jgi:hypothetical protein
MSTGRAQRSESDVTDTKLLSPDSANRAVVSVTSSVAGNGAATDREHIEVAYTANSLVGAGFRSAGGIEVQQ